ncbi:tethering complex ATP-binding subunit VPS33 Ecym_3260 [Eremothecium cymbalariae DBVPG|uniref:Uncharacterized protein n=1 Tax=Eremothecium cymbalariae (strain CBS 270.75 / DBVPG 7215 / KCTC 17166 / NRRL Y-17582) TaxID=931890 RepID=G8JRI4_ERECY|nr:Hypothetical protein Ecym_3260 [Eremothecium cymbalariae DBVPG\
MVDKLDAKKFKDILRDRLFTCLTQCSSSQPIVLIVQPNLVSLLNTLCPASQLTQKTQVTLIVKLDDDCVSNLKRIDLGSSKLVTLIDVRSDLKVPKPLHDLINEMPLNELDIIYATWEGHIDKYEKKLLPNHLELQLENIFPRLHPWYMLPLCFLDDILLNCNVLFTRDLQNLYYPKTTSFAKTTRTMLVNHLIDAVMSLCCENDITITHSISLGRYSKRFVDGLRSQLNDLETSEKQFQREMLYGEKHSGLQTNLIVIERQIDPLTPLLSQLTYSGMLNDIYGFTVDAKLKGLKPSDILEGANNETEVTLDYSMDNVWDDLKFINFGAVGTSLNIWAKELKDHYDSRHQVETVGEIKQFVDSLGEFQDRQRLLKLHTGISSKIMDHVNKEAIFQDLIDIEQDFCMNNLDNKVSCEKILDLMYAGAPREIILRLCCLLSLTKNGIRDKDFTILKTELVDTFGIDALMQLERLSKYGYILNKTVFSDYNSIKDFHTFSAWYDLCPQLDKSIDPLNPNEPTFSLCGIIPLSVRILESMYDRSVLLQNYSSQQPFVISRTPTLSKLEQLFESQYGPGIVDEQVWDQSTSAKTMIIGSAEKHTDLVILVFLGGITVAEIATIKFLQRRLRSKKVNKHFVVVTDGLLNSNAISQI